MKLKCAICKEKYHNQTIITCSKCLITVHEKCYGVDNTSSKTPWLCFPCKDDDKTDVINLKCVLCSNYGGALRRSYPNNEWVHSLCCENNRYYDISLLDKERFNFTCNICNDKRHIGVHIQCFASKCYKAVHPYCLFQHTSTTANNSITNNNTTTTTNKWKKRKIITNDGYLVCEVYCEKHSNLINHHKKHSKENQIEDLNNKQQQKIIKNSARINTSSSSSSSSEDKSNKYNVDNDNSDLKYLSNIPHNNNHNNSDSNNNYSNNNKNIKDSKHIIGKKHSNIVYDFNTLKYCYLHGYNKSHITRECRGCKSSLSLTTEQIAATDHTAGGCKLVMLQSLPNLDKIFRMHKIHNNRANHSLASNVFTTGPNNPIRPHITSTAQSTALFDIVPNKNLFSAKVNNSFDLTKQYSSSSKLSDVLFNSTDLLLSSSDIDISHIYDTNINQHILSTHNSKKRKLELPLIRLINHSSIDNTLLSIDNSSYDIDSKLSMITSKDILVDLQLLVANKPNISKLITNFHMKLDEMSIKQQEFMNKKMELIENKKNI